VLGSNLVDSVLWDQCIFTQNQTIPNTAVDWIYISPPGSGSITNNSSSTVFINGDQIKGPIYEATDHVTAPYFGSNTTPAQSGVFRTFFGAAGAMKARSNLGAYDVQEVAIDGFDDVFVGDGTHGSSVVAQFKTGGFFQVSQTTGKRIAQDVTGTLDTQNGILFDQILFKKTIAASASTVAFSYGLTSGHGARVRAEWVARDTTSGDTYSATIASAVKNVASSLSIAGTATQVLGCGDAGLSTATVAVTAISSSQITFTCTPPAAYANNIDWQIRVVVLDN
jgi:hypothetical protein